MNTGSATETYTDVEYVIYKRYWISHVWPDFVTFDLEL